MATSIHQVIGGWIAQHELSTLGKAMAEVLADRWHLQSATVLASTGARGDFRIVAARGLHTSPSDITISKTHPLVRLWKEEPRPFTHTQRLSTTQTEPPGWFAEIFAQLHAVLLVPFATRESLWGMLALGQKVRGAQFTVQEGEELRFVIQYGGALFARLSQEHQPTRAPRESYKVDLLQKARRGAVEHLAEGIAHEIHNPLTVISGKAQLLLLNQTLDTQSDKWKLTLKSIVKQTTRAADITRKLLAFSRTVDTQPEIINFRALVDETIALLSYQCVVRRIRITTDIAKTLPPFQAQVHDMRDILHNVMLNAIQAISDIGSVEVSIQSALPARHIEIMVKDTGHGIPEAEQEGIFDPFVSSREGAVGLGLFLTQHIVHSYGGAIRVDSRENVGTTVTMRLPVKE